MQIPQLGTKCPACGGTVLPQCDDCGDWHCTTGTFHKYMGRDPSTGYDMVANLTPMEEPEPPST